MRHLTAIMFSSAWITF